MARAFGCCVDPSAAGRPGPRRWVKPGSTSTQGCGWLAPVAQYQGEAGEDIHFFLSKHPPIASIPIDCEKPAAPLKGEGRPPRARVPGPRSGDILRPCPAATGERFSQVRLAARGTAAASCGSTPARPPEGPFLPASPGTSSDPSPVPPRPRHPGFEAAARAQKVISCGRCVATLAAANCWTRISRTLPYPCPARASRARPRSRARRRVPRKRTSSPSCAPKCNRRESSKANSQRGAIPSAGL